MATAPVIVEEAVRRYATGKPAALLPAVLSLLSKQQPSAGVRALASQLHADVAKRPPSAAVSNSLLCYYLRSSRLDLALAHLRCRSTPRDSLTYNTLLNHLPASSTTFRLFRLAMRDAAARFRPNIAALLAVLRASSSDSDHVQMIHSYLLKTAACIHTPVANSLLAMFATLGDFASAATLFGKMPARDVASWTSMIGACLGAGYAADALRLFREMVADGALQVDGVVAVVVLRACAMLEDVGVGASVHAIAARRGLQGDLFVANSLVDMYAKCLDVQSARKVFDHIAVKNVVSWNTMLSGLVHAGSYPEALHLLACSTFQIGAGDETTLAVLLQLCKKLGGQAMWMWCRSVHGAAIRRRLLSMALLNALLDAYGKCGLVEDMLRLFQGMRERNVITWSTVIAVCAHNGRPHAAMACFAAMRVTGERPNSVTVLSLVEACANCAEMRASRHAHGVAVRSGLALELAVGNALVHMYGKCGDLGASARVFNTIPVKDVLTWNSMIGALGMNGRAPDALALLRRMEAERGVRLNGVTMLAALSACAHGGLVEEGIACLESMARHTLQPRMEHLSCVVDMLARAGDLDGAAEIVRSARGGSCPAAWSALLSACRRRGDGGGEVGRVAAARVLELEPGNSAGYLLSMGLGKGWAAGMRSAMREKGVKVESGHSVVHAGGERERFVWGDGAHRRRGEVYAMLHLLHRHMKHCNDLIPPNPIISQ
ncbi:hypothetical protein E2562_025613 [Oryza meyeriana var. granulata]|uniref:Pentacotripeptide-repeat region of PRORP domain-containing protein n=1 Tax=Oryza meyeriana var. granulata TaxID=110450 RepID=A0A6G1FC91_9ORYZ|nr:hypothetical protein E2562_025613 [Oryza meyeriana var. granulata]